MTSSPIRCRGPWKIHKRTSEPDRWLDEMGFFRKHTARDASCLFRAVSENIFNTQRYYHRVRYDCIHFMTSNRHLFEGSMSCSFDNYLKEMSNSSESGGLVEISALSHMYRRDFIIFEANKGPQTKICNGYGNPIYLFYSSDTKHFDVVYTKDFINASSFCQSLVYEILYDGVYQLKDLPYAIDKMLHDKLPSNHIEYFMTENVERRKKQKERAKIFIETIDDDKDKNNNAVALKCKHHMEDVERASLHKESLSIFVFNRSLIQLENVCMNCLNVNSAKDLLDNGITPFPYKVAKALDPDIYRNIEFDVWSEMRKELRYGARYSDGTTLQVGVKCLCKLGFEQSIPYHCHIQEMRPDGGPCLVFIEELGEKRVVDYEQLEPLPSSEARPWAPPYRYSRTQSQILSLSQMLQQIGNITKKQSLKSRKGKGGNEEKTPEKCFKQAAKISWNDMIESNDAKELAYPSTDYLDFVPMPVEVQTLPIMVDCRPASAAAPLDQHAAAAAAAAAASNGASPTDNHQHQLNQSQGGGSGDMGGNHVVTSPGARASTPAPAPAPASAPAPAPAAAPAPALPQHVPYATHYQSPSLPPVPLGMGMGMGAPYMGYSCGGAGTGKGLVWVPPPPPPPPHHVNPHAMKSIQPNGTDLPMNDIPTLRHYYNLGVECMWAAYGAPPPQPAPPPPPPQPAPPAPHHPHHPPRHYSPRDIAQDMQQMSIQERGSNHVQDMGHKHKNSSSDKPMQSNGKGNGQRSLLGPRFNKRGNGQDGNQNNNHNKNHINNNHVGNKGPNNRRNEPRHPPPPGACYPEPEPLPEAPMLSLPYIPYPPPVYPVQYYPVDANDPAMMGMMTGMQYCGVGYEEALEYPHYYPPPPYPAAMHLPPQHEHK